MKLYQFINHLKKARKLGYKVKYQSQAIRLYNDEGFEFCPLTCVDGIINNNRKHIGDFNMAARDIELDKSIHPSDIVTAADSCTKKLRHRPEALSIRKKMIKALFGLNRRRA